MSSKADKCSGKTLNWLKLSNSGDILKLMIPSHSRKAMSGQNNYLGTVTSHKMNESEMGYRGSKSEFIKIKPQPNIINTVKEQRVDGSWCIKAKSKQIMHLRCTLMDFERNYPVKIPSNQFNRFFSTISANVVNAEKIVLNPYFVTGFADAESCFSTTIYKDHPAN